MQDLRFQQDQSPPPHYFDPPREEVVDLLVVGGGITGAGIAFAAGLQGLTTVLFERRDYGSGTSSRSSKLIHGGLRYLQQGNLHLVFEAVRERRRLRCLARHLVRPLPFLFPHYRSQKLPRWVIGAGLWIYEGLAAYRVEHLHRSLTPGAIQQLVPDLNSNGLTGGYLYYDAGTQDARLVYELIRAAREAGVHTYSYTEVTSIEPKGDQWQVHYQPRWGERGTLFARVIILAIGAFGYRYFPEFLPGLKKTLRPTKGVHLVLNPHRFPPKMQCAVVMEHPRDRRVTFLIPGRGYLYLGTTDTDEHSDLDEPPVLPADVEYLLEVYHHYFPHSPLDEGGITATWAGLRPLLDEEGKGSPYTVSREHRIEMPLPGLFIIEGGKLTTFRAMAEESLKQISGYLNRRFGRRPTRSLSATEPLPGSRGIRSEEDLVTFMERFIRMGLTADVAFHLTYTYGVGALAILPYIAQAPETLLPHLPYTWGEIRYILEHEDVYELEDLLLRRTEIYYQDPNNGLSLLEDLKEALIAARGFPREHGERSAERYRERVKKGLGFREEQSRALC